MDKSIQVFNYKGSEVRTVEINGEIWFVGKDVATVLGYSNANDALIRHVDEEDKLTSRITMAGQGCDVTVINESGLYSLIFSSQLPTAKQFKGEGKVKFDGFPETSDTQVIQAWTVLAGAINKNTIKQHHVRAKKVDDSNEKFSFRTWLTRLGLNGSDLKMERNILYRNLSGHTAFRNEEAQRRWTERQKAKQEALREQKAMAATTATAANVEDVED